MDVILEKLFYTRSARKIYIDFLKNNIFVFLTKSVLNQMFHLNFILSFLTYINLLVNFTRDNSRQGHKQVGTLYEHRCSKVQFPDT